MKTTYWVTTSLLALVLAWSSYGYIFQKSVIEAVGDLGFPSYFRVQLAVMKLLAIVALLVPQVPAMAKEWAYAGVGLFFITAIVAHAAHKDPWFLNLANVGFIALLAVSYSYWHKLLAASGA